MDLSLFLKRLYHKDIRPVKTKLGLSNDIYTAVINEKKVAIRLPRKDLSNLLNVNESVILPLVRTIGLDVNELYYDATTGIRITEWVEDTSEFKDLKTEDRYLKACALIKEFHRHPYHTTRRFDLLKLYSYFTQKIKVPLLVYPHYEKVLADFAALEEKPVFSHNDLVSGNMLFTTERAYLIDYEYAGMNHPYFDLISFITENNIDDEKIRQTIYAYYFDNNYNAALLNELTIIEAAADLLWAAWANALYDSRQNVVYLDIFNDKYRHLRRLV